MMTQTESEILRVQPDANDIFFYQISHSFSGPRGLVRILISALFITVALVAWGRVDLMMTAGLLFIGLMNPVVTPPLPVR